MNDIRSLITEINGHVEPEKQNFWIRLKGKLNDFIELSHLAAEEMRIEADEMHAEAERARLESPAGRYADGHERYNHS